MEAHQVNEMPDHQARMRMFRSQRNMYISGADLVLAFILWRLLVIFGPEAKHTDAKPLGSPVPETESKVQEKALEAEAAAAASEPAVVPENAPEDKKNN